MGAEIEEQLDRLESVLQSGARATRRDTDQRPSAGNGPATAAVALGADLLSALPASGLRAVLGLDGVEGLLASVLVS